MKVAVGNGEGYRMRLIDADMLRDAMFHYYGCVNDGTDKSNYKGETLMNYEVADLIEDCISTAPTVDAEQIRHGHWIYKDYCVWICSRCRENPTRGLGFVQAEEHLYEYCPHCGAKMDGGGMSGNEND